MGTDFDAFKVQDYRARARQEEFGANPWTVFLILWATVSLIAMSWRHPELRVATMLAVALSCGYLFFTATARWSVFVVRYQVPLLVPWSSLIALSLERIPRFVGRAVGAILLLACVSPLLDGAGRSLLHPTDPFRTPLAAYFPIAVERAAYYEAATQTLSHSRCRSLGIANWILVEYPLWVGLRQLGWQGRIEHIGVQNESRRLADEGFRPCALIREVKPDEVFGDDGNVALRFGDLGLTIDPDDVLPTEVTVPGFFSSGPGLGLLPGVGWALGGKARGPTLVGEGSLYLWSSTARPVHIQFRGQLPANARIVARGHDLETLSVTAAEGAREIAFQAQPGITRIHLQAETPHSREPISFTEVTVR